MTLKLVVDIHYKTIYEPVRSACFSCKVLQLYECTVHFQTNVTDYLNTRIMKKFMFRSFQYFHRSSILALFAPCRTWFSDTDASHGSVFFGIGAIFVVHNKMISSAVTLGIA